jgi:hypothetical protein
MHPSNNYNITEKALKHFQQHFLTKIDEGDRIIYVDLVTHIAILPVPKYPLKDLKNSKIDVTESIEGCVKKPCKQLKNW